MLNSTLTRAPLTRKFHHSNVLYVLTNERIICNDIKGRGNYSGLPAAWLLTAAGSEEPSSGET